MNGTRLSLHLYGWLCVALAIMFYANFRNETLLAQYLAWFHLPELSAISLPLIVNQHLSSFLQAGFFGYLAFFTFKDTPHKPFVISIFTFASASVLEILQVTTLLSGTFDLRDLFAIVTASVIAGYIAYSQVNMAPASSIGSNKIKTLMTAPAFIGACLVSMGCYEGCDSDEFTCVEPVTLTWEDLRADIEPVSANTTTLTSAGKIVVNGNYVFVIDQYRGVHIFDKTNNQNPTRVVFIPIPGALNLSIQGDEIYVNSFTDFLVINYQKILDGAFDQSYVSRQENMFLPPAFSNFLPDDFALKGEPEDYEDFIVSESTTSQNLPATGFIIGYIDSDNNEVLYAEYNDTDSSDSSGDDE